MTRTDTLWETFLLLMKRSPLYVFLVPFWLASSRSRLKHEIAKRVDLDVASLPYNIEFLSYLGEQRSLGRVLVLCSGSNERIARAVAAHLGIFEAVVASDLDINLTGSNKARYLIDRFGEGGFDYAGNELRDKAVIDAARAAVLVDPSPALTRALAGSAKVERIIPEDRNTAALLLMTMRPHQWAKNLLLFVPLLASHNFNQPALLLSATIAFTAFCLCASSAYVLNDLLDLSADRREAHKRDRPLASGRLDIRWGLLLSPLLLALSFALALAALPPQFVAVLMLYVVVTVLYSFWLKAIPLVDVLLLSGLYTLRVIAGAAAVTIEPSFWLLAFSVFLFLSLANSKRYAELLTSTTPEHPAILGRGYSREDLGLIAMLGITSGYLSVMVLALYVNSAEVIELYSNPKAIWLLCPILLYWISRIWMKTYRGRMSLDPVVFAISDPMSYALAAISVMILFFATG